MPEDIPVAEQPGRLSRLSREREHDEPLRFAAQLHEILAKYPA